jgi:DNA-binding NtrC family response regulator
MNEQILFVDGDQTIVEKVSVALGEMGYQVRMETSGMEALKVFSHNPAAYDLIITDLGMPDISGLLLAEKFLRLRDDIPIVLLTGPEGEKLSRERQTGIQWFGMKPLSMIDLSDTIRKALAPPA